MSIRWIVSDMDDTLLNAEGMVSERTRLAVSRARQAGAHFMLASGRMTRAMMPAAQALGVTDPLLALNGAEISAADTGAPLEGTLIPTEVGEALCQEAERVGAHIQGYWAGQYFFREVNDFTRAYAKSIGVEGTALGCPLSAAIRQPAAKFLIISTPERVNELMPVLQEKFAHALKCLRSRPHFIEITSAQADKGRMLARFMEQRGVSADEVLAFGDSQNDVTMLQYAGHGYVMANAQPDVRAQFSLVAPSNREDGVAQVIERLLDAGAIGEGARA